jgi:hypothetical protein
MATIPKAHTGGSSRRIRDTTTRTGGRRSSELAINEPASANITPIAGTRRCSQGQPTVW